MNYVDRLAAAEAAVPDWPYDMAMEYENGKWLHTDPHKGLDRTPIAWYAEGPPPVSAYTREQFEAACAAAGIDVPPDSDLGSHADKFASPNLGEWPDDDYIALMLRRRRIAGMEREAPPKPAPPPRDLMPVGRPRPARCHTGGDCSSLCSPDTCPCGDGYGWFHCC